MDGSAPACSPVLGDIGTDVPFLFARRLEAQMARRERMGPARGGARWRREFPGVHLHTGRRARSRGRLEPPVRTHGEMLLDPQEIVSHPRIALALRLWIADRFARYFDNVFFNLNLPWTVK